MSQNASTSELEMSRVQREPVNSCWEECQYESGMNILEQLRSPRHRPSADHIRQLVYLALHSSAPNIPNPTNVQASPSKVKRERFSILPKTASMARRLLDSFMSTNTPEGLFITIPSFASNELAQLSDDDQESILAKESLRVTRAKSCWDLLKSDFIKGTQVIAQPRRTSRRSSRNHGEATDEDEEQVVDHIVGEDAWFMLQWIVHAFERQVNDIPAGEPRYSKLLLAQIPPERSGKEARTGFNRPLDIAFYALQQENSEHRQLGIRLLTQLINLSSTVYLDSPMFIDWMFNILSTSTQQTVSDVISLLPPSTTVLRFKISLCQRLLATDTVVAKARPSVKPRAQPKTRDSSLASIPTTNSLPAIPSVIRKFTTPTAHDIVTLVSSKVKSATLPILKLRFELLLSYSLIQSQASRDDQDEEWKVKQASGELEKVINANFVGSDGEGLLYRQMLQSIVCSCQ